MAENIYRIRNIISNKWWEGAAESAYAALILSGWKNKKCEIKVRTRNGCGGWGKCKEVIPETAADAN